MDETPWQYFMRTTLPNKNWQVYSKVERGDTILLQAIGLYQDIYGSTKPVDLKVFKKEDIAHDVIIITDPDKQEEGSEVLAVIGFSLETTQDYYLCNVTKLVMNFYPEEAFPYRIFSEQIIDVFFEYLKNACTSLMVTAFVNKVRVIFDIDFEPMKDERYAKILCTQLKFKLRNEHFTFSDPDEEENKNNILQVNINPLKCRMAGFL